MFTGRGYRLLNFAENGDNIGVFGLREPAPNRAVGTIPMIADRPCKAEHRVSGVPRNTVGLIDHEQSKPVELEIIETLCCAFGYSVGDIFERADDEPADSRPDFTGPRDSI